MVTALKDDERPLGIPRNPTLAIKRRGRAPSLSKRVDGRGHVESAEGVRAADAGLEHTGYTPKSLRHYFASVCIAGGVPVFEVAGWLGHKGTLVTEATYVHLLADAHSQSMDAIESAIVENAQHAQEARWS